ncbi:uncharacterized protein K02A2.6-like [Macrosteles quadrilineatus]|uniref:uncharacterized protein K02A2.6-like n=1 Tax=Macrosteles quadrilineatus TaxID=74068 RepID=UPI0023E1E47E|nr:uncharacterized protein K02A2.6-like [Macrosteles quadrilineatus]
MKKSEVDKNTVIKSIKQRFSSVFEQCIGKTPNFTCSLKLKDNSRPMYLKPRPVPHALREAVENELDKLEKEDIIEKVDQSEWGTRIVVIPKANGSVRICADYKVTVNQQLHDSRYPIPRIEDILNKMRNGNYFCTLDIYKAYLHLSVDSESSKIQTITTHKGTYIAKRLFFGIKTAPNEFHKFIDQVVQNLEGTVAYFDDIVVQGCTFEECKSRLIKVLEKLEKHNLHVNVEKCKFFERKLQYLGHIISKDGIQKSPEKVRAIQDAPRPSNITGVRQFLGLVQYYSKFIKDASTVLNPLHQLLRKDKRFHWSQECEKAFTRVKEEIASDTVLTPYNPDLPVILATDASSVGLSAVLYHKMPNNEERPIVFASRSLTAAERNYSQLDREATAVYWGCKKMFDYIYGRKFTLAIDNKPLMTIFHPDKKLPLLTSSRMLRYANFLSGFDYDIVHKKSSDHCNASDYLSRHPLPIKEENINVVDEDYTVRRETIHCITTDTIMAKDIEKETSLDDELSRLKEKLLNGEVADPEISLQDGIIFRGNRVVIPKKLQPKILQELHSTHVGIVRMKSLARNYCYWKNIDTDIESMVASCKACCENKKNPEKAPTHVWEIPKRNWQRVHIDYAGPFLNHNFLIVVDARSKWPEIYPIKSVPTTASTLHHLREIFSHHGLPEILVSDNATIFKSAEFQAFCKRQGIRQRFIAPGNPSTNVQAERFCQTLKTKLRCMQFEQGTLHEKLCALLFRYRATPLSTGASPAQLMFGRNLRTKLDLLRPSEDDKNEAQQPIFNKHFNIGERVQSRNYAGSILWKFGTVVERLGRLHYLVELDDGYVIKRHFNQLRVCEVPKDPTHYKSPLPNSLKQTRQESSNNQCNPIAKVPPTQTHRTLIFQNTNQNCSRQPPFMGHKRYGMLRKSKSNSERSHDTENVSSSTTSWEGTTGTETSSPTANSMPDSETKSPITNNEASSTSNRTSSQQEAEEPSTIIQQDAEGSNANSQPNVPNIRRSMRIRKPIKRMNL